MHIIVILVAYAWVFQIWASSAQNLSDCGWNSRTEGWVALTTGYGDPTPPDDNILVNVNLAFLDFHNLNELAGTIESTVVVGLYWEDPRLNKGCQHHPVDLSLELMEDIWMAPMTINAVDGERIAVPRQTISAKVMTGGLVTVTDTVRTKVKCKMDFALFPFDTFYCDYSIVPTLYSNIQAQWDGTLDEPVHFSEEFSVLASHSVDRYQLSTKDIHAGSGLVTTINVCRLHFSRYLLHYVMQAYIPNALTVLVAWFSFSIDPSLVPARITLNISALIAMVLQYGNVVKNIPKVGYLKSIDVWMLGCVVFIFCSLCEFSLLTHLLRTRDRQSVNKILHRIDWWSRLIYPVVFFLFALLYFCISALG